VGRLRRSCVCGPRQAGRSTDPNNSRCRRCPLSHRLASCSLRRGRPSFPRSRRNSPLQVTIRASVLAVALLASSPLLAAGSGTSTSGADVWTQETTTEQDDCWLPTLPSTDLSNNLAGFLPKPGSSPDSARVDRDLSETTSCLHPLSLGNDDPEDGASPKRGYSDTAMPARTALPDLREVLFWKAYLREKIFLKRGMRF